MAILNKFIIVPIANVTEEILTRVVESTLNISCRKNLAGTKIIFKYPVGTLEEDMDLGYDTYTHAEALEELATEEWTEQISWTSNSTLILG